jgi:protein gp37
MGERSNIQWCDDTGNFWIGCTKVSPGCANCYAEQNVGVKMRGIKWGDAAPRVKSKSAVRDALAWNKKPWICDGCGNALAQELMCGKCGCGTVHRRRVFSLSLGDWLDDKVPIAWLAEMLDTIRQCDQLVWILCTKRPENWNKQIYAAIDASNPETAWWLQSWDEGKFPANVILLASVENQAMADQRIPELLKIPAAIHGLSLEPLLGPVKLPDIEMEHGLDRMWPKKDRLKWLIIGGESGPRPRACHIEWVRDLVTQGTAAGIATFVKQLGANCFCDNANMFDWPDDLELHASGEAVASCKPQFKDKKGGNPAEWPDDLRIQQFPSLSL